MFTIENNKIHTHTEYDAGFVSRTRELGGKWYRWQGRVFIPEFDVQKDVKVREVGKLTKRAGRALLETQKGAVWTVKGKTATLARDGKKIAGFGIKTYAELLEAGRI